MGSDGDDGKQHHESYSLHIIGAKYLNIPLPPFHLILFLFPWGPGSPNIILGHKSVNPCEPSHFENGGRNYSYINLQ